jgi:hypothetical protein
MKTTTTQKYTIFWISAIAFANVAVHLCFYNTLGFHRDELLYFSLGQHLSAGYASVPPFTGFMAWCMIHLLGPDLFAARLLPALFSGIMVFLAAAIAKELKGGAYSRILAGIGILVLPLNLRGFYFFMPVFFDVFFWTLIFYLVIRWINTGKDTYLLLTGIVSGLGMMNKYMVLLQLFCLILVFVLSSKREIFGRKAFWMSAALAFLIFLPNLVWQVAHHFPVITHMEALKSSQLVHVDRIAFLTDQVLLLFAALFLVIPSFFFLLFAKKMKPWRRLVIACFLVVVILLVLRGKSYYTAGIYPFLVAAGAVFWEQALHSRLPRVILASLLILVTLPVLPAGIPVSGATSMARGFSMVQKKTGYDAFLRDEDGKYHALPQDYADMLGWDELASIAANAYRQVEDKNSCLLYCENYGQAGAIMILGKKYGLPDPVCFSESFYYWAPRKLPVEIRSLIYINDELGEDVRRLFPDIRLIGKISNPLAREYGTSVYLGTKPVTSFNAFWEKRVQEVSSPF